MEQNGQWKELENSNFNFVDLGRPAIFIIPVVKLKHEMDGKTVEQALIQFLMKNYQAYSTLNVQNFGAWMDGKKVIHYDESKLFKVSFVGKERITPLAEFLSKIAKSINEQCIYFEAGQYAALIYPAD